MSPCMCRSLLAHELLGFAVLGCYLNAFSWFIVKPSPIWNAKLPPIISPSENKLGKKSLLNKYKPRAHYRNFTDSYVINIMLYYKFNMMIVTSMQLIWPLSLEIDGHELFQGDILMTEDIRDELRDMGLYPSNEDWSRNSPQSSPRRSKRAAISNKARRWMGRDNKPEIPYQLESSVRKWPATSCMSWILLN